MCRCNLHTNNTKLYSVIENKNRTLTPFELSFGNRADFSAVKIDYTRSKCYALCGLTGRMSGFRNCSYFFQNSVTLADGLRDNNQRRRTDEGLTTIRECRRPTVENAHDDTRSLLDLSFSDEVCFRKRMITWIIYALNPQNVSNYKYITSMTFSMEYWKNVYVKWVKLLKFNEPFLSLLFLNGHTTYNT